MTDAGISGGSAGVVKRPGRLRDVPVKPEGDGMPTPVLVVLAAGLSTRYGAAAGHDPRGLKQLDPLGPSGEALMDYAIYDAARAGVRRAVVVTRREIEEPTRRHLERLRGPAFSIELAFQEVDALPAGLEAPPGRTRPWGPVHALLAAEAALGGAPAPAVVVNADDFYGREAFGAAVRWLEEGAGDPGTWATVPYALGETLSRRGAVKRGVMRVSADGWLRELREVAEIRWAEGGRSPGRTFATGRGASRRLTGVAMDGAALELAPDTPVCTSLFALPSEAFGVVRRHFAAFVRERGHDAGAECVFADVVNPALEAGELRVRVLPAVGRFLGVTVAGDRPEVVVALRALADEGEYPVDLAGALADGQLR